MSYLGQISACIVLNEAEGQVAPTQKFVWLGSSDVGSDDVHMEKWGVRSRFVYLKNKILLYQISEMYLIWMHMI